MPGSPLLDRRRQAAAPRHPRDHYVIGKEGGEIWTDFYAVPKGAPHRAAGYALINFLLTPEINKDEVLFHGYPVADKRVARRCCRRRC